MNTGIITVFKTNNCGSFLQAWALKKCLEQFGLQVSYIDYKSNSDEWEKVLYDCLKSCIKMNFKLAKFLYARKIKFMKYQRLFTVQSDYNGIDLCVFGSDTLWNFSDPFFFRNAAFFTGEKFSGKKISYAISVGSSKVSDLENVKNIKGLISDFDYISVRDSYSQSVIKYIAHELEPHIVVDPTLLLQPEDYLELEEPCVDDDFLLLYYFGALPEDLYNEVRDYAAQMSLKVISIGAPNAKFDKCIVNSPGAFLAYMKKAKFIVTNTFHGCVFSVLFNKQFAVNSCNKKKIIAFLHEYQLESRLIDGNTGIMNILKKKVDFDTVNHLISNNREHSLQYLKNSIE